MKLNKNLKILTALTFFVLLGVSCSTPASKEKYLKKFDAFVSEVVENHDSYTDEEWEKMTEKYEKFSGEWYDKFKDDFTTKEKISVRAIQAKFNYYLILDQSVSGVKQMFDSFSVKELNEQVQYYINNNMQDDLQKFYKDVQKAGKDTEEVLLEILKELNVNIDDLQNYPQ